VAASSSSATPKLKRAKVLTRRPKPRTLERKDAVLDTEKLEITEHDKGIPLAPETIPAATVKASIGPAEEHPKLLSPSTATELPKLTTAATIAVTHNKRRMTSVLDAILKSTDIPTHASTEAPKDNVEESREVSIASASPSHAKAETSGAKPAELEKEKSTLPTPEAASQVDLEYIVRHASRKQLSEEQVAEMQHYARDLKTHGDPWFTEGAMKMTFFTVYQTVRRLMFAVK
jgi:hypothetical protein